MTNYELALALSAKLEDEARAETLEKVKALITDREGVIKKITETGKKRFAYEIQKQREGYYYFIKFDAEATVPPEMESRLRIMDGVMRFLIVKDDLKGKDLPEAKTEGTPAPAAAPEAAPAEEKAAEEAPAEDAQA